MKDGGEWNGEYDGERVFGLEDMIVVVWMVDAAVDGRVRYRQEWCQPVRIHFHQIFLQFLYVCGKEYRLTLYLSFCLSFKEKIIYFYSFDELCVCTQGMRHFS